MKILRRALISLLAIVIGPPVVGCILFRVSVGRAIDGEGIAYLKKVDLDVDLRGEYFERPLGKKKLYVSEERVLFVSAEDWKKVWGDDAKRKIRYRVHPVLAGFGVAEIRSAESHLGTPEREANQTPEATRASAGLRIKPESRVAHL